MVVQAFGIGSISTRYPCVSSFDDCPIYLGCTTDSFAI
ncbi:hypothetical protein SPWS13_0710 [Shewanella putrefaciens]|nr:hypothetical protein SPWS13_0710 [Shewanella putrefaciens]